MRMEIEQEVTSVTPNVGGNIYSFSTTYTLLIRKTDLTPAPSTIFARYYTGPPGSGNQVTTVEFMKGTDNPAHDYHTYIDRSGADINTAEILSIKYFNLFTSNPSTGDQTSNPLNLHDSKSLEEIDKPAVGLRNTSVSVDVTQRIVNIGNIKAVDKSTAWRAQGLNVVDGIPSHGDPTSIRLASGNTLVMLGGTTSNRQSSELSSVTTPIKFYKLVFNEDKSDLTWTEVTLDTGVSYPSAFPTYRPSFHTLPDGKVLITGGARYTSASYYLKRIYVQQMFVLTINETTNKITNIRQLSHHIPITNGHRYLRTWAFNLSNGDVVIFAYSYNLSSSNSISDNTQNIALYKIVLGNTTDTLTTLLNPLQVSTLFTLRSPDTDYPFDIKPVSLIKKTQYYYLVVQAGTLRDRSNSFHGGRAIIKFPISNPLSSTTSYYGQLNNNFRNFVRATLLNGDLISFVSRSNPANSISIFKTSISLNENTSSATAASSELPSFTSSILNANAFFVVNFTNDRNTPTTERYYYKTFISKDGSIGILRANNIYDGTVSSVYYGFTGYWYVDIEGDTQVVVNRQYASEVASVEGHELTYGASFPITSLKNDTHVFDQDVASGLTWRDTDGSTALTSAKTGDVAVYNGNHWVKKPLSMATVSSQVPQQFRTDADTTGQLFQPKCFWLGTSTQLTAATKVENCVYMVPKTSQ